MSSRLNETEREILRVILNLNQQIDAILNSLLSPKALSELKKAENKSPFLIRGLALAQFPIPTAPGQVTLLPPAQIKVYTPPITKGNQPQTFNLPNGITLWMIIDNNLPSALDNISVSFDGGITYKTIQKGAVLNLGPFSIPNDLRKLVYQSPTASAPFELMVAVI